MALAGFKVTLVPVKWFSAPSLAQVVLETVGVY